MSERKKHPSGRPIRRTETKSMSIFRNPGIGPYIPRLQQPQPKDAIGFHHFVVHDSADDEAQRKE